MQRKVKDIKQILKSFLDENNLKLVQGSNTEFRILQNVFNKKTKTEFIINGVYYVNNKGWFFISVGKEYTFVWRDYMSEKVLLEMIQNMIDWIRSGDER